MHVQMNYGKVEIVDCDVLAISQFIVIYMNVIQICVKS